MPTAPLGSLTFRYAQVMADGVTNESAPSKSGALKMSSTRSRGFTFLIPSAVAIKCKS